MTTNNSTTTEPNATDATISEPTVTAETKPSTTRKTRSKIADPTPPEAGHKGCTHGPGAPRRACRETRAADYFTELALVHHKRTRVLLDEKIVAELMANDQNKLSTARTTLARVMRQLDAFDGVKVKPEPKPETAAKTN